MVVCGIKVVCCQSRVRVFDETRRHSGPFMWHRNGCFSLQHACIHRYRRQYLHDHQQSGTAYSTRVSCTNNAHPSAIGLVRRAHVSPHSANNRRLSDTSRAHCLPFVHVVLAFETPVQKYSQPVLLFTLTASLSKLRRATAPTSSTKPFHAPVPQSRHITEPKSCSSFCIS